MTTYAELMAKENVEGNILAVIKPRRIVSGWTLVSGTTWYVDFPYGRVRTLFDDGFNEYKSESTTYPPSGAKWYFDESINRLYYNYVGLALLGVSLANNTITVTYELYAATSDIIASRVPTDSTTTTVFFPAAISSSPKVSAEVEDSFMGFVNTSSSGLTLNNATHWMELHLHDGSFNKIDIDLYHSLGSADGRTFSLLYAAICYGVDWNQDSVSLVLKDRNTMLSREFRSKMSKTWIGGGPPSAGTGQYDDKDSFFDPDKFLLLDPAMDNRPIRTIFGKVNGVIPVNFDYNDSAPSIYNNRKWYVGRGNGNSANITVDYVSQTSGKVKLSSITGIEVGDTICLHTSGDYPPSLIPGYGFKVTALYPGTNELGHSGTTLSLPGAPIKARRSGVSAVYWVGPDGAINDLIDGKHYSYYEAFNYSFWRMNGFGFRLNEDFETEFYGSVSGIRKIVHPSDRIWCTAYGEDSWFSVGATPAPTASNGCVDNGVALIYQLLIEAGISANDIDSTTFNTLIGTVTKPCGLAIPEVVTGDFPKIRELIGLLLKSLELRLFVNISGKWTLRQVGPTGTPDYTLTDAEIIEKSIGTAYSFDDVQAVVHVGYDGREVSEKGVVNTDYYYKQTSSTRARNLHAVMSEMQHNTALKDATDAAALADHLSYALSERKAITKIKAKNEFIQAEIGDVITVSRDKLPGYVWDSETDRSRDMVVIGTSKGIDGIELTLDDQKGIEDNEGSW